MGYSGDIVETCGTVDTNLQSASVIVVSGDGPNVCGHMLVATALSGGNYFHVADLYDYPKYMDTPGYRRYLRENGKRELGRYRIRLPEPVAAQLHLEQLMSERWPWMVLPNNCVHFVEEVLQAGGADFGLWTNCPAALVAGRNARNTLNNIQRELTDRAIERRIWEFQRWAGGR